MAGLLFIVSAPSGTGKTSLIKELLKRHSAKLEVAISHTTRLPRTNEVDGKDYHFISEKEFLELTKKQAFLETASVFSNYYGTSFKAIDKIISESKDVLLEIDYQGAQQVIKKYNAVTIFILPPSIQSLAQRLHKRGKDKDTVIKERLAKSRQEISQIDLYDYALINDNFSQAVDDLEKIIHVAQLRNTPDNSALQRHLQSLHKIDGH